MARDYRVGYGEPDSDLETLDRRWRARPQRWCEAAFLGGEIPGEIVGEARCLPFAGQ